MEAGNDPVALLKDRDTFPTQSIALNNNNNMPASSDVPASGPDGVERGTYNNSHDLLKPSDTGEFQGYHTFASRPDVLYCLHAQEEGKPTRRFHKDTPWIGVEADLYEVGFEANIESKAIIAHHVFVDVNDKTGKRGNTSQNWRETPSDFELGRDADLVSKYSSELNVNSKRLVPVLEKLLDYYPSQLGSYDSYEAKSNIFVELMHCYAELKDYFNRYLQSLPQGAKCSPGLEIGSCGDENVVEAVRASLDFGALDPSKEPCDEATALDIAILLRLLAPMYRAKVVPILISLHCQPEPTVKYDDLWYIFRPGTRVYVHQSAFSDTKAFRDRHSGALRSQDEGPQACIVAGVDYKEPDSGSGVEWFQVLKRLIVKLWSIDYDGHTFRRRAREATIFRTSVTQSIKRLQIVPANLYDIVDGGLVREKLKARGKKYLHVLKEPAAHREYHDPRTGYQGQVIVDPGSFGHALDFASNAYDYELQGLPKVERWDVFAHIIDGGEGERFRDIAHVKPWNAEAFRNIDEVYLLLPSTVGGFGLKTKEWIALKLDCMSDEPPRPALNQLDDELMLMSDADRAMLRTVLPRGQHLLSITSDFIVGKGEGQIFLLYGPPGTGKTLTVECVANDTRRPLLTLTFGDVLVGINSAEERLREWFALAAKWDAILLMDEADAFLAQRYDGNQSSGYLTITFLRTLEYYKGILFLTTNRPGHIDDSFISRITYPIRYEPLTLDMKKRIIERFVHRFEETNQVEVESQAKTHMVKNCYELNGRQIRNILQNAVASADVRRRAELQHGGGDAVDDSGIVVVKWHHVKAAIERQREFVDYLDKLKSRTEVARAKARHDWAPHGELSGRS